MKRSAFFLLVCFLMIVNNLFAQQTKISAVTDSTGLPGDNFSLQGALEMFKQSKTPEDFEKKLNTENNYVNNLDLNGDGKIDYVRVIDKSKSDAHAIVLQVAVNKTEVQDIAVIEIEKQGRESAILQIIGDQELYGDSTIVEPMKASGEKTKGTGPSASLTSVDLFFVNVWFWPCVFYIYQPAYVVYESPYYWDYYPYWWSPWYPMPWYRHHYYCNDYYYQGYRPVYSYHVTHAHDIYYGHRRSSPTIEHRYQNAHQQYQNNRNIRVENGNYNNNSQGRSGNYNQGRNGNGNQGNLNNHLNNKTDNINLNRNNNNSNQPSGKNQIKLNNSGNKPGNNNQTRPNNTYQNKPGNNYQSKPSNVNQGRQGNNFQSRPNNNAQSRSNNNVQSRPNNNIQSRPNNNIQSKPGNNIQGRSSNNLKQQPGNVSRSVRPSNNKFQNGNSPKSKQGTRQNNSNRNVRQGGR